MSEKPLFVKCPNCKDEFHYYSSKFRPFCSEKCKMIDMGHWFDESYNIKGKDYSALEGNEELIERMINGEDKAH